MQRTDTDVYHPSVVQLFASSRIFLSEENEVEVLNIFSDGFNCVNDCLKVINRVFDCEKDLRNERSDSKNLAKDGKKFFGCFLDFQSSKSAPKIVNEILNGVDDSGGQFGELGDFVDDGWDVDNSILPSGLELEIDDLVVLVFDLMDEVCRCCETPDGVILDVDEDADDFVNLPNRLGDEVFDRFERSNDIGYKPHLSVIDHVVYFS